MIWALLILGIFLAPFLFFVFAEYLKSKERERSTKEWVKKQKEQGNEGE